MSAIKPSPVFSIINQQYQRPADAAPTAPLVVQPAAGGVGSASPNIVKNLLAMFGNGLTTPNLAQNMLTTTAMAYVLSLGTKAIIQRISRQPMKEVLPWGLLYGTVLAAALNLSTLLKLRQNPQARL